MQLIYGTKQMDLMGTLLTTKAAKYLAGLIGALLSLYFMPRLTPFRAVVALLGGTVTAAYLTPIVAVYWGLAGESENAAAFIIGLLGMNLLGGLFLLSTYWRNNPRDLIKDIKS